jgi:hypothetical protein
MLSELPDCLLGLILSLACRSMGARELVQMSTVSRRWRHLWRETRCLDIGPQEFESGAGDDLEKWARFNNFVDSFVLQHGDLDLDALRMQVIQPPKDRDGCFSKPDGDSWVHRFLSSYSPAVLDIHNSSAGAHVELRGMSDGTVLRRLTTLRLTGVTLCPLLRLPSHPPNGRVWVCASSLFFYERVWVCASSPFFLDALEVFVEMCVRAMPFQFTEHNYDIRCPSHV